MFNRRIHVSKYTVANIISNSLIINEFIEKMCFVNWRFRSFVQYIFELQITQTRHPKIVAVRGTDGVEPLLDLLSPKRCT